MAGSDCFWARYSGRAFLVLSTIDILAIVGILLVIGHFIFGFWGNKVF